MFEFARGAYHRGVTETVIRQFFSPYIILPCTEGHVWKAARIDADLSLSGQIIGSADVWIAAAALETGLPVLTVNIAHFSRVPGVKVIGYAVLP